MNTETKHTRGPWLIGPMNESIRPDVTTPHVGQINGGCIIATLYGSDMAANANLIAAAPDLYDELKEARGYVYELLCRRRLEFSGRERTGYVTEMEECIDLIDAALAKAEGKS